MESNVLVISEHTNKDKIERHIGPLARKTKHTTMVCLSPNNKVDISYIKVPSFRFRTFGIALMFFVALTHSIRRDYDLIVSFSLFPYGFYALIIGTITQTPTHLGILGADLDVHAHSIYKQIPIAAFKRFDSISVLGSKHRDQLTEYGVLEEGVFILTNAIDTNVYNPETNQDVEYDFVWSGRFAPEKDPLIFIKALYELRSRGYEIRAAILGTGELDAAIKKAVEKYRLRNVVDLPGWIDDPVEYYSKSRIFVLTSKREALGLSLLESMAMGLGCIAPNVGNIPDVAEHESNALVVDNHNVESYADAMERLLVDDDLRDCLGKNAISVGQVYSYENAQKDWSKIISHTVK